MNIYSSEKRILTFLFIAFWLVFQPLNSIAQCGGTYFKRLTTTLVRQNGRLTQSVDMTGDSVPDLIGTKFIPGSSDTNQFIILPSDGSGGFGAPLSLTTPNNIVSYTVGDFDTDNFKDLFVRFEFPTPNYRIYKNNGDGTFTQFASHSGQGGLSALFLTDINNDGKGDLILYTSFNSEVRHHLGNGDGTFQSGVTIAGAPGMLKGDFNADGLPDFMAGANLLINQGGGNFTTVPNAITFLQNESVRDVRDYNGDGKSDLVTHKRSQTASLSLHLNTGNNTFQRTEYPLDADQQFFDALGFVIPGNFSGNAAPDLLYTSPRYARTVVFTNDGAGNFSRQNFKYVLNNNLNMTGDFDSDGKTDTLDVSNGFSPTGTLLKFFPEITVTVQKNVCQPVGQTRLVDFDATGMTGLTYWTPGNGWWGYQPYIEGAILHRFFLFGSGSLGDIPTPGDFDGDGATDPAVYRDSTGTWWINRSSDQQPAAVQFGLPGDKPVVGDYDGDSVSDVAVWRPSDGNWYVLFMGTESYTIAHWGQDGDKPAPEDYDGDGKTDLAVFRPSTGTWYYLKSSDLNFASVQFGLGTDKPVPADYDGDGKADIAVYRESNNVFHLLRSYNLAYSSYLIGGSGDIVQPGDYNGDFVFELGFYRPSTQSWGVMSRNPSTNFGGSNVVPAASMLRIE